jgi:uncharacterized protein (TIGR03000 family)
MKPAGLFLFALVLLSFGLTLAPRAEAAPRWARYRPSAGRMPGWDWWRTYPWSPYNYGRNPYNPIVVPPPYVMPYGYPYPDPYPVYQPAIVDASPSQYPAYRALGEPSVSGPLSSPPPGTALIRLHAPNRWARVDFDGEEMSTMGLRRTFVTPTLPDRKTYRYVMTVTWKSEGKTRSVKRVVRVRAGEIREIDLSRAAS